MEEKKEGVHAAGEASPARLFLRLSGLPAAALHAEFARFSAPLIARTTTAPFQPQRYAPPRADELRLALVGDGAEVGAWGMTAPLLLAASPDDGDNSSNNSDNNHALLSFAATVRLPAATVQGGALRFRLVIVDEPLLRASCGGVVPGAAIVAVENARWDPDVVPLVPDLGGETNTWRAHIDLRRRALHFDRASKQFPFLSQLSNTPAAANDGQPTGPLLSLTMYANDPRERYEQQAWLGSLPQQCRDAVMYLQRERVSSQGGKNEMAKQQEGLSDLSRNAAPPLTSYMEVEDIYPVPCDGCCWCEERLPTPAPMEKQNNIVKESTRRVKNYSMTEDKKGTQEPKSHSWNLKDSKATSNTSMAFSDYSCGKSQCVSRRQPLLSSQNTSFGEDSAVNTAMLRRGWCVEPLHNIDGLQPFSAEDSQFTMRVWHSTVNVAPLKGCGIQLEARIPLPIYESSRNTIVHMNRTMALCQVTGPIAAEETAEGCPGDVNNNNNNSSSNSNSNWVNNDNNSSYADSNNNNNVGDRVVGVRWVRGVTLLQPPLFKQDTRGTLAVPICFTDTASDAFSAPATYWHTVYIQYLFVFPFHYPQRNTLEIVRSLTSLGRLATKKPVGHRGLGKTYTRSTAVSETSDDASSPKSSFASAKTNRLTLKLAENSLESIHAAHRRGCDMVEFDVMLTRDRVPVIFHDPLIQLQARKKKGAGTRNGRVEEHVANNTTVPPAHFDAQAFLNFASVPIAVHQLTKPQLDVVTTETFNYVKDTNALRNLILRHWNQIFSSSSTPPFSPDDKCHSLPLPAPLPPSRESETATPLEKRGEGDAEEREGRECLPEKSNAGNGHGLESIEKLFRRRERLLAQQEDVTNRICTLKELFEGTPATLRFDLEVKYPFQPIGDNKLYLQSDAFEVNAFVDDILRVVFAYADQRQVVRDDKNNTMVSQPRDVIFSSFEPDVCLALKMKQSRFDVVFLCDTDIYEDFKDYRCFGLVEGALQFSTLMHLSGISIWAASLCSGAQRHVPSARSVPRLKRQPPSLQLPQKTEGTKTEGTKAEVTKAEVTKAGANDDEGGKTGGESHADAEDVRRQEMWASFDCTRGRAITAYAHARRQLVWTWGEKNNDEQFTHVQMNLMMVDAVITDNVPLWSSASDAETSTQGSVSEIDVHNASLCV